MKIDNRKKQIPQIHKSLIYLPIIGMWALFQFYNGNKLYSLFIVIFFIALVILRRAYFALVMVFVLVILVSYSPVLETWANLRRSNLDAIQSPRQTLTKIFTPNAGQEVLPPQVQQMLSLLKANRITSYQLSDQLNSDPLTNQRITEASWPIKKDPKAYYLLRYLNETIKQPSCITIDKRKEIALDYCH
jgi:hypothetical protein